MKLDIRLVPNASKNEIVGWTEDGKLKVKVQSPPVDGAANKGLIRFLASVTGVSKSKISILRGEKSREKCVELDGDNDAIEYALKGKQ